MTGAAVALAGVADHCHPPQPQYLQAAAGAQPALTASPVLLRQKKSVNSGLPALCGFVMCGRDRTPACRSSLARDTGRSAGELQSALRQNPVDWCWNRAGLCGCSPCSSSMSDRACRSGCSGLRSRRGMAVNGASAGDVGSVADADRAAVVAEAGQTASSWTVNLPADGPPPGVDSRRAGGDDRQPCRRRCDRSCPSPMSPFWARSALP